MKRFLLLCAALILLAPLTAFASLDDFLNSVNVQARVDLPGFSAKVSTQFGVPVAQVQMVLQSVPQPADAFMVFQLGQFARVPSDRVMEVYKPNKKKGWGAIAKELGIKPGSAEFHALKSGDLHFTGAPAGGEGSSPGKGKGKGKGHNK
jgi:hypothetical protein